MLTTTILVISMIAAAVALIGAAAIVLAGTQAPATPAPPTARQVRLVCPELGNLKRVLLEGDVDGVPRVLRCDRFGHREVTCDQTCLLASASLT